MEYSNLLQTPTWHLFSVQSTFFSGAVFYTRERGKRRRTEYAHLVVGFIFYPVLAVFIVCRGIGSAVSRQSRETRGIGVPAEQFPVSHFSRERGRGDPICVFSLHAFFLFSRGKRSCAFYGFSAKSFSFYTCKKSSFYMFPDSRQPNMAMSLILK